MYGGLLWAIERYLRQERHTVAERVAALRQEMERDLGGITRVAARILGPILLRAIRRDARRHPNGRRLEPRTWVERRPRRPHTILAEPTVEESVA